MRRVHHPEYATDLIEAVNYYDAQHLGLGSRFLAAVEATLLQIEDNPRRFRRVHRVLRRALIARPFPYHLFFQEHDDVIHIYAALHTARHPDTWKRRIQD